MVVESTCNTGDAGRRFDSWVRKIPWRKSENPTPCLAWDNSMDRASDDYSPWGFQKSGPQPTAEWAGTRMNHAKYIGIFIFSCHTDSRNEVLSSSIPPTFLFSTILFSILIHSPSVFGDLPFVVKYCYSVLCLESKLLCPDDRNWGMKKWFWK